MKHRVPVVTTILLIALQASLYSQSPKEFSVMLRASVSETPRQTITLRWNADSNQQRIFIWKKDKEWPTFPNAIADSVVGTGTSWTDANAVVGKAYEYRVFRIIRKQTGTDSATGNPIFSVFWGTGYITSGVKAPPAPRERMLVLVDTTMVAPLSQQLTALRADLEQEGWSVTQRGVERVTKYDSGAVVRVRNLIKSEWAIGEGDLGGVFIIGHIPIPYSGRIAPDGHVPDHLGAWPADGIYGDIDANYSDFIIDSPNTQRPANNNVPGDGKYDQSTFNSAIDIPVGRVDFYDMPAFPESETELLRQYLNRNHAYRINTWNVAMGGVIDDNFGTYGEVFAASAWRSFSVFGGDTTVKAGDYFTDLAGPSTMLLGYGCGGGTDVSAGGVGTTTDLVTKPVHAVFTMLFGSYFGDWGTQNNLLRASLASKPRALVCGWSGRPHWYLHHMALGETIGYSARISQNNQTIVNGQLGTYVPMVIQTQQGLSIASSGDRGVHIGLMGDPSLRAVTAPVATLGSITASTEFPNIVNLQWLRPSGDVQTYLVFRKLTGEKRWKQLTPSPITATTFKDSLRHEGPIEYRVNCCALRTTASGSFYDMGRGRVATVITTGVEDNTFFSGLNVEPTISVGPNPVASDLAITIGLKEASVLELLLVDVRGVPVWRTDYNTLSAGEHHAAVSVADLAEGMYYLRARTRTSTTAVLVRVAR